MSKKTNLILIIIFTILFFGVRLTEYAKPLTGEEGIHANIFYTAPKNPEYLQIARINGVDLLIKPEHPALLYESLGLIGSFWKLFINYRLLDIATLSMIVRIALSTIQYFILLTLLIIVLFTKKLEKNQKIISVFAIMLTAISVPVIQMSVSVQIDGSIGFLLAGLLSLSFISFWLKLIPETINTLILFFASLLFGFGKNEWSMAFLITIVLFILVIIILPKNHQLVQNKNRIFLFLSISLIGLVIGNLISYSYDSANYLAGFNVMFRISKASSFFSPRGIYHRLPVAYVNILLFMFLGYSILKTKGKIDFIFGFIFVFYTFMFMAYFAISWVPDPRYFAPSLILGLSGLIFAAKSYNMKHLFKPLVGIAFGLVILTSVNFYIDRNLFAQYLNRNQSIITVGNLQSDSTDCLQYIDSGKAFGSKVDFIANSMSLESASSLSNEYNKRLCK